MPREDGVQGETITTTKLKLRNPQANPSVHFSPAAGSPCTRSTAVSRHGSFDPPACCLGPVRCSNSYQLPSPGQYKTAKHGPAAVCWAEAVHHWRYSRDKNKLTAHSQGTCIALLSLRPSPPRKDIASSWQKYQMLHKHEDRVKSMWLPS